MIHILSGDLMKANQHIIGHQVNCMGVMGSGVARQIREVYPEAFNKYSLLCESNKRNTAALLGKCQIVPVSTGKYVANLFGQNAYGYDGNQYTNEHALGNALQQLKSIAEESGLTVALPYKIGCNRGGADWDEVYKLIANTFYGYEVKLYKLGA